MLSKKAIKERAQTFCSVALLLRSIPKSLCDTHFFKRYKINAVKSLIDSIMDINNCLLVISVIFGIYSALDDISNKLVSFITIYYAIYKDILVLRVYCFNDLLFNFIYPFIINI
jgi:hypothetical protein